jgi:hypothetical protein
MLVFEIFFRRSGVCAASDRATPLWNFTDKAVSRCGELGTEKRLSHEAPVLKVKL